MIFIKIQLIVIFFYKILTVRELSPHTGAFLRVMARRDRRLLIANHLNLRIVY